MKKILKSLFAIMAIMAITSLATLAYFSSKASSRINTFNAGTLDLQISNNIIPWGKEVTGIWSSPSNWAPGEEVTGTIRMTNVGTIDSKQVHIKFSNLSNSSSEADGTNLMDKIVITGITERFNSQTVSNQMETIAAQVGNKDTILTLAEFAGFTPGFYTQDDKSGDGTILQAGDKQDYDLIITFKFLEDAEDEYQGDVCGFNLDVTATQDTPATGMIEI